MENIVGDVIGFIHLIASCFALLFGTLVLIMKKGTIIHMRLGCLYIVSMLVLINSSFFIYRLFDGWGIFHYLSVISLITLILGIVPIWLKKPTNTWKYYHLSYMYWSVIGLYAAFVSEVLVRFVKMPLLGVVGIASAVIMLIGTIVFRIKKKEWEKVF